ncbi:CPBP family intramembrane metalloprotease [Ktedonosporobacter rubrisoli]|uniref:CPBP family intramembrane metalloprotease n=1 Tax=Ktedonosporobacter rubrisoli TaxID=2509675 RepID=A0A4P6JN43_KTERU|nr:CPBP family intramembrane glutamic endopeptidase [Ktedonosporobacter rubrisoli]QBD76462.1 CPBP family intramembrane metalloprotease [Ktedonosporobacter rubrisoli]
MENKVQPAVATRVLSLLSNQKFKAVVALAFGTFLFILPTPRSAVAPIDTALHAIGLLSASASNFERFFAAALVVRWLQAVLLLLFVLVVLREPLSFLGIRSLRWRDVALAVGLGVLGLALNTGLNLLLTAFGVPADTSSITGQIITSLSLAGHLHLIANAAIYEELFFRGLLMECLIRIFNRPWLAAIVSYALFVGGHYLSGSASLARTLTVVGVGTLVLVGLYVLRRNVTLCMITHAIMDSIVVSP